MKTLRFAAIDIGSNAVRLLISSISLDGETESYQKLIKIRSPLRLGQESFVSGENLEDTAKQLIQLMKEYSLLIEVSDVTAYRACATSAMRDAVNSKEIIEEIKRETDLTIEVVDGQEESRIIYKSHFAENLNKDRNYISVDVGGGSTEISLILEGELIQSKSYNIGTIRLLNDIEKSEDYDELHKDLHALKMLYPVIDLIGSGGNIIALNALAQVPKNEKLSVTTLESLYDTLKQHTAEELIEIYKFKVDRADVIEHAASIYIDVARNLGANDYIVPNKRLIDGIIHSLYMKWKDEN